MGRSGQLTAADSRRAYQPMMQLFVWAGAGTVVDRYAPLGLRNWLVLAALFGAGWLLAWQLSRPRLGGVILLCAVSCVAAAWHHDRWRCFSSDEIGRSATEFSLPICLEATALTSPRLRPAPRPDPLRAVPQGDRTHILVAVRRVRDGAAWRPACGRSQLTVKGHVVGVSAGDRMRIYATLFVPRPPQNPGDFDFAQFYRHRRQLFALHANHPACIQRIGRGPWWHPRRWLNWLRDTSTSLLRKHVDARRAGLAAAMLLGARELVDPGLAEDFLTTGTAHLLAVSGLHVGILVSGIWWLRRLGLLARRGLLLSAIIFVVVYALLADARPPVLRAAILVGVFCCASLCGRSSNGMNALAFAGLLLLMANPPDLFQTGPQLSFLAVATLHSVARQCHRLTSNQHPLERLIARSRPWPARAARQLIWGLVTVCLTSTSIWLVSLPLVVYRFHVVAPIGIAVNPLMILPMGAALYSGFGVLCLGWLVPPLADLCGWCCGCCLGWIEWGVQTALAWQGPHVWVPAPPWWWVAGFYLALGLGYFLDRVRLPIRWVCALWAIWFAMGLGCVLGPASQPRKAGEPLSCTFIAVGHGTSVLLELPGGQAILYDAGQLGSPSSAVRMIAASLWSRGRSHLDAVILSHADVDHFNALPGLLNRFTVGVVYSSPQMLQDDSQAVTELKRALRAKGIPFLAISAGDVFRCAGDTTIEVLHPTAKRVVGSDNANSLVLIVAHAGRKLLLPGDLEAPGLDQLLAQPARDCDLIMAPHHGSPRSDPRGLAEWCQPEWVIISGGDRITTAEQTYRAAGARVLSTAEVGAVAITVSPHDLEVRSWKLDPW